MLITVAEIAKELRVHRQRVYEWLNTPASQGGLPHYQFGSTKRVDREVFNQWLKERMKA